MRRFCAPTLLLLLTDHVLRSDPVNLARPYTIGTAFPNKTLDDDTQTIKDAGIANSVVLQKWV
jgi:UBX domain-containing protein 1